MKWKDIRTNQDILNNYRTTDKLQANDFYAVHFINYNIIVRTIIKPQTKFSYLDSKNNFENP